MEAMKFTERDAIERIVRNDNGFTLVSYETPGLGERVYVVTVKGLRGTVQKSIKKADVASVLRQMNDGIMPSRIRFVDPARTPRRR